jgi:CubicO group peptidase (beta-lactamase class C family)
MSPRRHLLPSLALLALPALTGCDERDPSALPPLDEAAMRAVVAEPGISREKLARAVDALFTAEGTDETRAVVVMHAGQIVAERYAPPYHENTRFLGWSVTKTVTGVLIGLLVSDGRLRLDESVPLPAWQRPGDARGEITLRQLLQMRSGLRHSESIDPIYKSDEVRMLLLEGRDDMARYAESQPLEAEPGGRFEYSTATSVILADIAARVLSDSRDPAARRRAVSEYLRTRLVEPVGLRSMLAEYDAAGTLIGGSLIHASARDWARFGEFLRNYGSVRGAQVVPRGWIEFMTRPSPRNPGYGAQVWLNRRQVDGDTVLFPDQGPPGVFAAIGHLGQYVVVSPRQKLVVVRLGKTDGDKQPLRDGLARIVRMFPVR